ncbi:MAG: hypothetical protein IH944_12780 [Armatimonadetes bacterium]|nr:hypothetical protein [Armatimonadota bacterium]
MRLTIVPVATLALSLLAVAAPSGLAEDVKVRLKVGETYRYETESTMIMEVMGEQEEIDSSQIVAFSALSAKGGWTKLEAKIEEFDMDESPFMEGADLDFLKDAVFSFEVNDRGQTREFKMDSGGGDDPMMSQILDSIMRGANSFGFMGISLPKGPLKVGMTWTKEIDADVLFGEAGMFEDVDGKLEIESEITKFGTVDGRRMMTIASIMSGAMSMTIMGGDASMEMESQIVTLITVSDGLVYSSEAEGTNLMESSFFEMEQRMSSKTKRLMK